MAKRTHTSLLFADNKDIYDLLLSSESTFKREGLREMALQRGIVVSSKQSRIELIKYISLFPHDLNQLNELLDAAAPPERQHSSTLRTYNVDSALEDVQSAAEEVRKQRTSMHDEEIRIVTVGDTVLLKVTYSELDPSRTRLEQKRTKDVTVELEKIGKNLRVRSTPGAKSTAIVDAIVEQLVSDKSVREPREIDLNGLRDAGVRTQFFLGVFTHLKAFKEEQVTDVRLHRLDEPEDEANANDKEEAEEDRLPKGKMTRREAAVTKQLRNASFEGENLLAAAIVKTLKNEGYFLTRMVWTSDEKLAKGSRVEFEAWFNDAKDARDFRYRIRSVADRDNDGVLGAHRKPEEERRKQLLRTLEDAAQKSYDDVQESQAKLATASGASKKS